MYNQATIAPYDQSILKLNGFSVIESCTFAQKRKRSLFLEDHLLLFVQHGIYSISYGGKIYDVQKNEMVLLKKAIVVQYLKSGDIEDEGLLDTKCFS